MRNMNTISYSHINNTINKYILQSNLTFMPNLGPDCKLAFCGGVVLEWGKYILCTTMCFDPLLNPTITLFNLSPITGSTPS